MCQLCTCIAVHAAASCFLFASSAPPMINYDAMMMQGVCMTSGRMTSGRLGQAL